MHTGTVESRWETSLRLLGQSWRWLRAHPRLLALPAMATVALAAAATAIYLPLFGALDHLDGRLTIGIATGALLVPLTFITTFFNVGFLAMVLALERGEQPTIAGGLRAAWGRLPQILGWTVLASGVGGLLAALQRLGGGDWLLSVVGWLGGLAWGLATFFAVPVLALEGTGPIESVRRSSAVFRQRWGETVSGDVTLGVALNAVMIPGFVLVAIGALALEDGDASGAYVLVAGILVIAPVLVVGSALGELFTLQLYLLDGRPGATGPVGPFDEADLRKAVKPRERSWWEKRRRRRRSRG